MTLRAPNIPSSTRSSAPRPNAGAPAARLTLRASPFGSALIGPGGEVVFYADGVQGRRACLEFARQRGVLALSS